uniref:CD55 molecule (Cromer blood group) n=1 Tax=Canis lupus familiaris TaxID=9615 RepID=A0A8P0NDV7_CANLF
MGLPRALTPPPPLLPLLLLLLLLLRPPAARGNCTFPPVVPNAQPILGDRDSFPENITVTYKCNEGFVKVPGKSDSVICLDSKWSQVAEFCNRSCDVPTRLLFATLKKSFSQQNYFPEGSVVEYECRPGYRRDYSLSEKLTCLKNFKWSKPDEFCKKKSCPNPGDLRHGHVTIPNDILFGSSISFSCNVGYRLVGAISSYCVLADNSVEWSDPLPECQEIFCPDPPEISNGLIYDPQKTYVYQQSVKYKCTIGFTLIGENSIYCTVKDDQGEWSGPPPECRGASTITTGKFGSSAVKRNCHYCGLYSPYPWKRMLSFKCLKNTIKMRCLKVSKRRKVNAFYRHICWTPLGTRYIPKYFQPCSCSKVILG